MVCNPTDLSTKPLSDLIFGIILKDSIKIFCENSKNEPYRIIPTNAICQGSTLMWGGIKEYRTRLTFYKSRRKP